MVIANKGAPKGEEEKGDAVPAFQRKYTKEVRRCDEMKRKLR